MTSVVARAPSPASPPPSNAPKWIRVKGRLADPSRFLPVLDRYGEGWNRGDIDMIMSCFSDDIRYRDFAVNRWLTGKRQLHRYLGHVFRRYPDQAWENIEVMPHDETGVFTVTYRFHMKGAREKLAGEGMEKIVVRDERICLDDVYIRIDDAEVRLPFLRKPIELLAIGRQLVFGVKRSG